ncbi:hypothetical protein HY214_04630 [Candidatus Roizmanbacteria bacterium]|nr:hypothetical protein [Candidatus Roizmanbacteria bacterium]
MTQLKNFYRTPLSTHKIISPLILFTGRRDTDKLFRTLLADPNYRLYYHEGDQYIFKRKT